MNSSTDPLVVAEGLLKQGLPDAAFDLAIKAPNSAARLRLLINILISRKQRSDLSKALKLVAKWKRLQPDSPEPWSREMEIHVFNRHLPLARKALTGLRQRSPDHARTFYYQAMLLCLVGRIDEAFQAMSESVKRNEKLMIASEFTRNHPGGHSDIVSAMMLLDVVSGIHPGSAEKNPLRLLDAPGVTDRLRDALTRRESELNDGSIQPEQADRDIMARGWYRLGCAPFPAEKRVDYLGQALHWNPHHPDARANRLFLLNYCSAWSPTEIFRQHLESGEWLEQQHPERTAGFRNQHVTDRPLRIGYLSSDFRRHPVAHFILPILQNHQVAECEIHLYHDHAVEDEVTQRAQTSTSRFSNVHTLTDAQLASRITEDRIDILVELNGYSENSRMPVLALRPAPVQIAWIGYPNTTGLSRMNYRLVDEVTDPSPGAQALATEQLIRLPGSFSVYDPLEPLPPVRPSPCLEKGSITFASFNNLDKLNNDLLEMWAEILHRMPGSTILIKDRAMSLNTPRQRISDLFGKHGIDSERIRYLAHVESREEHLSCFHQVDICLDSFPYNGTTTTCESLIMGVPVVALAGDDHRSRVSASQLNAVGLQRLVASTPEEYVNVAVELACDHNALAQLREVLRDQVQNSALMDAAGFTRNLESVYRQVWRKWCGQQRAE